MISRAVGPNSTSTVECPHCSSEDTRLTSSWDWIEDKAVYVVQAMRCDTCGRDWKVYYSPVKIELDDGTFVYPFGIPDDWTQHKPTVPKA